MSDYKTANLKPETMQRLREYAVGDESVDSAVQRLLDENSGTEVDTDDVGLSVADYLMAEYNLPEKVAREVRQG